MERGMEKDSGLEMGRRKLLSPLFSIYSSLPSVFPVRENVSPERERIMVSGME